MMLLNVPGRKVSEELVKGEGDASAIVSVPVMPVAAFLSL